MGGCVYLHRRPHTRTYANACVYISIHVYQSVCRTMFMYMHIHIPVNLFFYVRMHLHIYQQRRLPQTNFIERSRQAASRGLTTTQGQDDEHEYDEYAQDLSWFRPSFLHGLHAPPSPSPSPSPSLFLSLSLSLSLSPPLPLPPYLSLSLSLSLSQSALSQKQEMYVHGIFTYVYHIHICI